MPVYVDNGSAFILFCCPVRLNSSISRRGAAYRRARRVAPLRLLAEPVVVARGNALVDAGEPYVSELRQLQRIELSAGAGEHVEVGAEDCPTGVVDEEPTVVCAAV